ncbi:MAG: HipA domain-containing protein [Gemmatimonadales bacterium]|nr:HipA domain-containing protein [Gemmatimonadales bacterium]
MSTLSITLGDRRVGTVVRLPDDRITFAFDPAYSNDPDRPTLSLGFKTAQGGLATPRITHTKLAPYFTNLLPEGALRTYLAARVGTKPVRDFPLLAALGSDLPGNVRAIPSGSGPLSEELVQPSASTDRLLKFSLAGVQLKFSALESVAGGLSIPATGEGGNWIIKLPSPTFPQVPTHELVMLELARAIGIPVPETRLVSIDGIEGLPTDIPWQERQALAVRRFDRQEGQRIHTEDFAQVFGRYPDDKYTGASSENIARVLLAERGVEEVLDLVTRLVFTVLIGNGDMHLKNWSLIYRDGRTATLSPAYDYISTIIYMTDDTLGLSIGGSKVMQEIGLDHFAKFADRVGVPSRAVSDRVHDTVTDFKMAWRNLGNYLAQLPAGHVDTMERYFASLALWRVG